MPLHRQSEMPATRSPQVRPYDRNVGQQRCLTLALETLTMPKITVLPHPEFAPNGTTIDVATTTTICDALLDNGVDIEHACGKVGACTTCHVVVKKGFDVLNPLNENEEDMLDMAWGLQPQSRLSCQAIVNGDDDVVVEIPKYTINHAKETV